jgi:uncharacterized protein YlaN (UPF0358 family)
MNASDVKEHLQERVLRLLHDDADKIEKLIAVQMENLATRKCPLYEEVLDTQIYGFSRVVDFAIRAGLVDENEGKSLVKQLERNLALLYEAMDQRGG